MLGLYVRVVAATGMRRSEACGLRWSDVDLPTGRLTVARSYVSLPGVVGDRPTKTRSARTVTLDDGTVEALRTSWRAARQLARFAGVDDDIRRAGYVFSFDADGARAWRGDTVTGRWERVRRAAGVTGVRLHDLRHWQATQLLDAGVPVPTVAARLGHADGTTTMKIYAHRTERADEEAALVVGAALDPVVEGRR
jgi:integrase